MLTNQIYMLSSLNHHLSILHLRVHRRYLDIISKGTSTVRTDSEPEHPWHILRLRRTRWYDLFDPQERLAVFRGIWTLFHCLLRRMEDSPPPMSVSLPPTPITLDMLETDADAL